MWLEVAAAAAAGGGSAACLPCLPAAPAVTPLWRLDSPLLRHLSSSAAVAASQAAGAAAAAAIPALPQYEQLQARAAAGSKPLALRRNEQAHFDALLRNFHLSGSVKDQALALYVNSKVGAAAGSFWTARARMPVGMYNRGPASTRTHCCACLEHALHMHTAQKMHPGSGQPAFPLRRHEVSRHLASPAAVTPPHPRPVPVPALPLQLYAEAVPKFQEFLLAAMDSDLRAALLQLEVSAAPGSCPGHCLAPPLATSPRLQHPVCPLHCRIQRQV